MKLNKIISQPVGDKSLVIPTGIASLDRMMMGGLRVGHVFTVGARPAMGKTAFVMSLVRNIGIINRVPTAVLSMQYAEHDIARKLWAAEFGWKNTKRMSQQIIVESKMNQDEKDALSMLQNIGFESPIRSKEEFERYKRMMLEAPVWIEHDFMLTMDEAICKMERLKKENNVSMIVLDGLDWIVTNPHTYAEQKHSMQKLVQTAERLQIAVVLTQELNRNVENRVGNWPTLSDLRDGYSTETLTSMVMLIYRPEYYGIQEDEKGSTDGKADIIIAKNAFGDTGSVRLNFFERARFEDEPACVPSIEMPPRMNDDNDDCLFPFA